MEHTFSCNYPKVKAIIFVSRYMVKKYGEDEAFRREMKKKNPRIFKTKPVTEEEIG